MQCKDIADEAFVEAVVAASTLRGFTHATRWDVAAVLAGHPEDVGQTPDDYPEMPERLVLAKARKLIRRGVISGCVCGCRGEFRRGANEPSGNVAFKIEGNSTSNQG